MFDQQCTHGRSDQLQEETDLCGHLATRGLRDGPSVGLRQMHKRSLALVFKWRSSASRFHLSTSREDAESNLTNVPPVHGGGSKFTQQDAECRGRGPTRDPALCASNIYPGFLVSPTLEILLFPTPSHSSSAGLSLCQEREVSASQ